jgi:hypothetical protein
MKRRERCQELWPPSPTGRASVLVTLQSSSTFAARDEVRGLQQPTFSAMETDEVQALGYIGDGINLVPVSIIQPPEES